MEGPEDLGFEPAVPLDRSFDAQLGLDVYEVTEDEVRGRLSVGDGHKQPFGIVNGGVFAAIAESLASIGTAAVVVPQGMVAMGLSNQTSFLRPVSEGSIDAVARARHKGRTTWVWEVELSDDQGRLCSLVRMTIAVRPMPGAQPG